MTADNDSAAAAAACWRLHSIFDDEESFPTEDRPNSTTSSPVNYSSPQPLSPTPIDWLTVTVTSYVNPVFCGVGVLGNLLTIVILCRRRMKDAMSCRIERASRAGLFEYLVLVHALDHNSSTVYNYLYLCLCRWYLQHICFQGRANVLVQGGADRSGRRRPAVLRLGPRCQLRSR